MILKRGSWYRIMYGKTGETFPSGNSLVPFKNISIELSDLYERGYEMFEFVEVEKPNYWEQLSSVGKGIRKKTKNWYRSELPSWTPVSDDLENQYK